MTLAAGKVDNQFGNLDGQGTAARFGQLDAVAIGADGNMVLTDTQYGQLRRVSPQGLVSTLPFRLVAPTFSGFGGRGVAVGRTGTLFWGQNAEIRKAALDGTVSSPHANLPNLASTVKPQLAVDGADNLYVTTRETASSFGPDSVWKVAPNGGLQLLVSDSTARFSAITAQSDGSVYLADRSSVRKISNTGAVSLFAGALGHFSDREENGLASDARFGEITALAVDRDGTVFVVENVGPASATPTASRVRRIFASGMVDSRVTDQALKPATGAQLDAEGNLYLLSPHHVTRIDAAGHVSVFAGNPDDAASASADGTAAQASFASPDRVVSALSGTAFVLEGNGLLRRVNAQGVVTSSPVIPPEFAGLVAGVDFIPAASIWKLGGIDGDGNAYVSMSLKKPVPFLFDTTVAAAVVKVSPTGQVTSLYSARPGSALPNVRAPQGLGLDKQGNLLVSYSLPATGDMSRISTAGQALNDVTLPGLAGALAWKLNAAGQWLAYGCDISGGGCWIRTVSAAGDILSAMAIPAGVCNDRSQCLEGDVAQDAGGNVYFTHTAGHRVYKAAPDGAFTTFLGKQGSAGIVLGDAPASLYAPRGIDIDSRGTMHLVSDKALLKVQLPP